MRRAVPLAAFMFVVLAGAAALRLVDLGNRSMHCDEAVHADKFRLLLEQGEYVYNPREYHGPSLNYLTLPIARAASARKLTQVTEVHLRLVPAVFGIALVGLVGLLRGELGAVAVGCAAVLTAVSPAMVFYSRYYIQEMLLVCFTFAAMVALWRYARGATQQGATGVSPVPKPGATGVSPVHGQDARGTQGSSTEPGATGQGATGVSPVHGQDARGTRRGVWQPWAWLVVLGLSIAMMHTSKETCVLALAAMALAAGLTMPELRRIASGKMLLSAALVVVVAAGTSALFFSSLFQNPPGVLDSVTTYFHYLGRASGEGSAGLHDYPWYHYAHWLFWWPAENGPRWTEAAIALLALVGLVAGAGGWGLKPSQLPLVRFFGIYTVVLIAAYSAMPYKTPWCALGFLQGLILLAGVGAAVLLRAAPGYVLKTAVIAGLLAATGHLAWQAHRASFVAYEAEDNPYVYAHTTSDVPLLAEEIKQIAALHPDGTAMHVQVICPDDDHWPLPWYLREFRRVDWYPGIPGGRAAPVIITRPELDRAVLQYVYVDQPPGQRPLRDLFRKESGEPWQLRPHVPLLVLVRLDLLQKYRSAREEPSPPAAEP